MPENMTPQAYRDRMDILAILELADELIEGKFYDPTYIFKTPVATVRLYHYSLDGDTTISIHVPGQEAPLVELELIDCQDIKRSTTSAANISSSPANSEKKTMSAGSNAKP